MEAMLCEMYVFSEKMKVLRIASFAAPALHVEGSTCADAYGQTPSFFHWKTLQLQKLGPQAQAHEAHTVLGKAWREPSSPNMFIS